METLRQLIAKPELTVAPLVLNPLMARMAEDAGFNAIYLGGGSLGWLQCVTEANITLPEMARVAVDIRTVCRLPIILEARDRQRAGPTAPPQGLCLRSVTLGEGPRVVFDLADAELEDEG